MPVDFSVLPRAHTFLKETDDGAIGAFVFVASTTNFTICDIVDSEIRNTLGGETIMSDEEFLASYNSDTATKEEELRLINILLNMPDEDY